jgi:hypothetical protein
MVVSLNLFNVFTIGWGFANSGQSPAAAVI